MFWSAKFSPPIAIMDGAELGTLADARDLLNRLKGYQTWTSDWQAAVDAVLHAGTTGQAIETARVALIEAMFESPAGGAAEREHLAEGLLS
jgi:hypothetical protein